MHNKHRYRLNNVAAGVPSRVLLDAFYARLDELFPGNVKIPIPDKSEIKLTRGPVAQACRMADYAVRVAAPIALDAIGLTRFAATQRALPKVELTTAESVADQVDLIAHEVPPDALDAGRITFSALSSVQFLIEAQLNLIGNLHYVAVAAATCTLAARFDAQATWEALNQMLREL